MPSSEEVIGEFAKRLLRSLNVHEDGKREELLTLGLFH